MKEFILFIMTTLSLLLTSVSVISLEEEGLEDRSFRIFRSGQSQTIPYERKMENVYTIVIEEERLKPLGKSLTDIVGDFLLYEINLDDIEINGNKNTVTFRVRHTSYLKSGLADQYEHIGELEFKDKEGNVYRLMDFAEIHLKLEEEHLN